MTNPNIKYKATMLLSDISVSHSRQKYGLLDLLGDLGGVLEVLLLVSGAFFYSYSEYSFVIKAMQKLFLARSFEKNIFERKTENADVKQFALSKKELKELKYHKRIKLSNRKICKLYFSKTFESCFYSCMSN